MINFLIGILFAAIPDSLYYYLLIKNIKEKKHSLSLYLSIFSCYLLFNMVLTYNLYLYLLYIVFIYFSLKIIYKSKINDFFLILFIDTYFILISILCYFLIPNYAIALIINKILLFLPLLFKEKLIYLYKFYNKMWNRNREVEQPIKSLTLRNISIVVLNIMIIVTDLLLIYLSMNNS